MGYGRSSWTPADGSGESPAVRDDRDSLFSSGGSVIDAAPGRSQQPRDKRSPQQPLAEVGRGRVVKQWPDGRADRRCQRDAAAEMSPRMRWRRMTAKKHVVAMMIAASDAPVGRYGGRSVPRGGAFRRSEGLTAARCRRCGPERCRREMPRLNALLLARLARSSLIDCSIASFLEARLVVAPLAGSDD